MYTYTTQSLTKDMNMGKDTLISTLLEAGVIDSDQFKTIQEDFAIIIAEKGFFGKTVAKILGWTDDNALYFKCVQIQNFNKNKKENEDVHQPTEGDK